MTVAEVLERFDWREADGVYLDDPARARRFVQNAGHLFGWIDQPADVDPADLAYRIGYTEAVLAQYDRDKTFHRELELRGIQLQATAA